MLGKSKHNKQKDTKLHKEQQCHHCDKATELTTTKRRQPSHRSLKWMAEHMEYSPEVKDVISSVQFIAENMRSQNENKEVRELTTQEGRPEELELLGLEKKILSPVGGSEFATDKSCTRDGTRKVISSTLPQWII